MRWTAKLRVSRGWRSWVAAASVVALLGSPLPLVAGSGSGPCCSDGTCDSECCQLPREAKAGDHCAKTTRPVAREAASHGGHEASPTHSHAARPNTGTPRFETPTLSAPDCPETCGTLTPTSRLASAAPVSVRHARVFSSSLLWRARTRPPSRAPPLRFASPRGPPVQS